MTGKCRTDTAELEKTTGFGGKLWRLLSGSCVSSPAICSVIFQSCIFHQPLKSVWGRSLPPAKERLEPLRPQLPIWLRPWSYPRIFIPAFGVGTVNFYPPPSKEIMLSPLCVCRKDNSKSCRQILMIFWRDWQQPIIFWR